MRSGTGVSRAECPSEGANSSEEGDAREGGESPEEGALINSGS
ncbi:hypothetical protein [Candidatus Ichthyocystis sparus]|nr:hypothetical protein [Candidatus Ichthyocystis sparus]